MEEYYYIEDLLSGSTPIGVDIHIKNKDNCLCFMLDSYLLFMYDIEKPDEIIEIDYSDVLGFIKEHYYDISEFFESFIALENKLGHELFISDRFNNFDISIRQLYLFNNKL